MDIKAVAREIKLLEGRKNKGLAKKKQISQELEMQQLEDIEESSPVGIRE